MDDVRAGTVRGVGNGASGSTFEVDIESLGVGESSRGHQCGEGSERLHFGRIILTSLLGVMVLQKSTNSSDV